MRKCLKPISRSHENGKAETGNDARGLEHVYRAVVGALRSHVDAHGPSLSGSAIGSAAKRIVGAIRAGVIQPEPPR